MKKLPEFTKPARIPTPLWRARYQWWGTGKMLNALKHDFLYGIQKTISMCETSENLKNTWFQNLKIRMLEHYHAFEALPPRELLKFFNVVLNIQQPPGCATCGGLGYVWEKSCWCMKCEGWGMVGVAEHFRYLRNPDLPGIVVYRMRNGAILEYFTIGTKVTPEIL